LRRRSLRRVGRKEIAMLLEEYSLIGDLESAVVFVADA
jgi:hypothetical protein